MTKQAKDNANQASWGWAIPDFQLGFKFQLWLLRYMVEKLISKLDILIIVQVDDISDFN